MSAGDVGSPQSSGSNSPVSFEKSEYDVIREQGAEIRALKLLERATGTSSRTFDKSPADLSREHGAEIRALRLMDSVVENNEHEYNNADREVGRTMTETMSPPTSPISNYTAATSPISDYSSPVSNYSSAVSPGTNYSSPSSISAGALTPVSISPHMQLSSPGVRILEDVIARGETTSTSVLHHDKTIIDVAREREAGVRALELMDQTVAQDKRAIRLLEETIGGISTNFDNNGMNPHPQVVRRREAQQQAMPAQTAQSDHANRLLEKHAAVQNHKPRNTTIPARHTAEIMYEQKMKEKGRANQYREHLNHKVRMITASRKLEDLTETTRKKKELTPDDVLDPESVAGMKCQLDLERQELAKQKALKLLNEGFMSPVDRMHNSSNKRKGTNRSLGFFY